VDLLHPSPARRLRRDHDGSGEGGLAEHFERLQRLLADGRLILAGPTLGGINTGLVIFDAPDEEEARQVMAADPVISGGFARGELRPFRVSLLRGRD
jgi:uncharacterized protein YciI